MLVLGVPNRKHTMSLTVAALYHFTHIDDPETRRDELLSLCRSEDVYGTLILAKEGINGTIAGPASGIENVIGFLNSWPEIDGLEVKYSASSGRAFKRMKVKVKQEIVTMGIPEVDVANDVGTYVDPKDWNELIERDDVLIVDTRNSYEFGVGRFSGAVDPETETFGEFPAWAQDLAETEEEEKPNAVAMYCTGGIRCEKATAYMRELGFDEVYHLKGGILKYLEQVPEEKSLWEGECFVFDERVAVGHGLAEGDYRLCYGCMNPISPDERESSKFEEGVSCSNCFDSLSDYDRDRFRERQKQINLAKSRGESHFEDRARLW